MASSINAQSDTTVGTLTKSGDATGNLTLQTNGLAALHINNSQNITANSTGAITVNVGNTAQRPTGANGMIRYSNTSNAMEVYVNGGWANVNTSAGAATAYNIAVAVVAGGGATIAGAGTAGSGTTAGTDTTGMSITTQSMGGGTGGAYLIVGTIPGGGGGSAGSFVFPAGAIGRVRIIFYG